MVEGMSDLKEETTAGFLDFYSRFYLFIYLFIYLFREGEGGRRRKSYSRITSSMQRFHSIKVIFISVGISKVSQSTSAIRITNAKTKEIRNDDNGNLITLRISITNWLEIILFLVVCIREGREYKKRKLCKVDMYM